MVLKTPNDEDTKSLYKIEKVGTSDESPIIIRQFHNRNSKVLQYKIISPDDQFNAYNMEDTKNYLIIKSKKEAIDVVPYGLVQRLDKIKYMILWLNLYCEMHPDCDKSVLDEELRKVSCFLICILNTSSQNCSTGSVGKVCHNVYGRSQS